MMAKRYPHFLRPAKGNRYPPRILCVDAVGVYDPTARPHNSRRERMESWCALSLLRKDGDYHYHAQHAGHTWRQWLELVRSCLSHHGETWVVSSDCARIWALLDVYRFIEDGVWWLCPNPAAARTRTDDELRRRARKSDNPLAPISGGTVQRILHREDGCLVSSDAVSLLVCRDTDLPGKLVWIDVGNYGCDPPEDVSPGKDMCECLARYMRHLCAVVRDYSLGSLQHTAGSQAYHGYRSGYYAGGVYVHNHAPTLSLETAGYYGGRCECYHIGIVPDTTYHMDYRSMYPWVMMHRPQPMRLVDYADGITAATHMVCRSPGRCIARVTLETEEPCYPYRRDHDIIYPVGRYTTTLPGPELEYAWKAGHVRTVHAAAIYDMGCPLHQYAASLYELRRNMESDGNAMMRATAKRLLVALPGKLGQRVRRWIPAPGVPPDYPWGEWYGTAPDGTPCRYRCIGSQVQWEEVGGPAAEALPAVAAWITSWGRLRLLEAIHAAGWRNTYYVDTDCVVSNWAGLVGLRSSGLEAKGECGYLQWKHGPAMTEIRGIKYYLVDDHLVCAGVPKGKARDAGDGKHYWYRYSPLEQIYHGQRPEAIEVLQEYQRATEYQHGVAAADGTVTPIRLEG